MLSDDDNDCDKRKRYAEFLVKAVYNFPFINSAVSSRVFFPLQFTLIKYTPPYILSQKIAEYIRTTYRKRKMRRILFNFSLTESKRTYNLSIYT